MIYAFKNGNLNNIWFAIFGYVLFFSLTIAITDDFQGYDIERYMLEVEQLSNSHHTYQGYFEYYSESGEIDFLRTLTAYYISKLTSNGYVLVIFYGVLFGYFFTSNFVFILKEAHVLNVCANKSLKVFFAIILFLAIPFWMLNGFRFWTGAHCFIYGILPYLLGRNSKRIVFVYLTPIIFHFSFVFIVIVFLIYRFLPKKFLFSFLVLLLGVLLENIDGMLIDSFMRTILPEDYFFRVSGYVSSDSIERFRNNSDSISLSWHKIYYVKAMSFVMIFTLFFTFFKFIKSESRCLINKRYFTFLSFLTGLALAASSLPSGSRFLFVCFFLFVAYILIYVLNKDHIFRVYKNILLFQIPLFLFFALVSFRIGLYLVSLETLLSNPLLAFFSVGINSSLDYLIFK